MKEKNKLCCDRISPHLAHWSYSAASVPAILNQIECIQGHIFSQCTLELLLMQGRLPHYSFQKLILFVSLHSRLTGTKHVSTWWCVVPGVVVFNAAYWNYVFYFNFYVTYYHELTYVKLMQAVLIRLWRTTSRNINLEKEIQSSNINAELLTCFFLHCALVLLFFTGYCSAIYHKWKVLCSPIFFKLNIRKIFHCVYWWSNTWVSGGSLDAVSTIRS